MTPGEANRRKLTIFTGALLFAIACICLVSGIMLAENYAYKHNGQATKALVVEKWPGGKYKGKDRFFYRYTYDVDGKTYENTRSTNREWFEWATPGTTTVDVIYLKDNPSESRTPGQAGKNVIVARIATGGVVILTLVLIIARRSTLKTLRNNPDARI